MKDNATGDVKITYYSSCLSKGQQTKTNKCSGLKVGDKVTFTANITVTKCPANPRDWKQVCNCKDTKKIRNINSFHNSIGSSNSKCNI